MNTTKQTTSFKTPLEKAVDANGNRIFTGTFSGDTEDREGEQVKQVWQANGVAIPRNVPLKDDSTAVKLMLDHGHSVFDIAGKVTGLHVVNRGEANFLRGQVVPLPAGISARADEYWRLVEADPDQHYSVGFRSLDYRNGVHHSNDLLEISAVGIPAFAGAKLDRSAQTAIKAFMGKTFEDILILDDEPAMVPARRGLGIPSKKKAVPADPDFAALKAFVTACQKEGLVLSPADEQTLRTAVENLQVVLAKLGAAKGIALEDEDDVDYASILANLTPSDIKSAIQDVVDGEIMKFTGRLPGRV